MSKRPADGTEGAARKISPTAQTMEDRLLSDLSFCGTSVIPHLDGTTISYFADGTDYAQQQTCMSELFYFEERRDIGSGHVALALQWIAGALWYHHDVFEDFKSHRVVMYREADQLMLKIGADACGYVRFTDDDDGQPPVVSVTLSSHHMADLYKTIRPTLARIVRQMHGATVSVYLLEETAESDAQPFAGTVGKDGYSDLVIDEMSPFIQVSFRASKIENLDEVYNRFSVSLAVDSADDDSTPVYYRAEEQTEIKEVGNFHTPKTQTAKLSTVLLHEATSRFSLNGIYIKLPFEPETRSPPTYCVDVIIPYVRCDALQFLPSIPSISGIAAAITGDAEAGFSLLRTISLQPANNTWITYLLCAAETRSKNAKKLLQNYALDVKALPRVKGLLQSYDTTRQLPAGLRDFEKKLIGMCIKEGFLEIATPDKRLREDLTALAAECPRPACYLWYMHTRGFGANARGLVMDDTVCISAEGCPKKNASPEELQAYAVEAKEEMQKRNLIAGLYPYVLPVSDETYRLAMSEARPNIHERNHYFISPRIPIPGKGPGDLDLAPAQERAVYCVKRTAINNPQFFHILLAVCTDICTNAPLIAPNKYVRRSFIPVVASIMALDILAGKDDCSLSCEGLLAEKATEPAIPYHWQNIVTAREKQEMAMQRAPSAAAAGAATATVTQALTLIESAAGTTSTSLQKRKVASKEPDGKEKKAKKEEAGPSPMDTQSDTTPVTALQENTAASTATQPKKKLKKKAAEQSPVATQGGTTHSTTTQETIAVSMATNEPDGKEKGPRKGAKQKEEGGPSPMDTQDGTAYTTTLQDNIVAHTETTKKKKKKPASPDTAASAASSSSSSSKLAPKTVPTTAIGVAAAAAEAAVSSSSYNQAAFKAALVTYVCNYVNAASTGETSQEYKFHFARVQEKIFHQILAKGADGRIILLQPCDADIAATFSSVRNYSEHGAFPGSKSSKGGVQTDPSQPSPCQVLASALVAKLALGVSEEETISIRHHIQVLLWNLRGMFGKKAAGVDHTILEEMYRAYMHSKQYPQEARQLCCDIVHAVSCIVPIGRMTLIGANANKNFDWVRVISNTLKHTSLLSDMTSQLQTETVEHRQAIKSNDHTTAARTPAFVPNPAMWAYVQEIVGSTDKEANDRLANASRSVFNIKARPQAAFSTHAYEYAADPEERFADDTDSRYADEVLNGVRFNVRDFIIRLGLAYERCRAGDIHISFRGYSPLRAMFANSVLFKYSPLNDVHRIGPEENKALWKEEQSAWEDQTVSMIIRTPFKTAYDAFVPIQTYQEFELNAWTKITTPGKHAYVFSCKETWFNKWAHLLLFDVRGGCLALQQGFQAMAHLIAYEMHCGPQLVPVESEPDMTRITQKVHVILYGIYESVRLKYFKGDDDACAAHLPYIHMVCPSACESAREMIQPNRIPTVVKFLLCYLRVPHKDFLAAVSEMPKQPPPAKKRTEEAADAEEPAGPSDTTLSMVPYTETDFPDSSDPEDSGVTGEFRGSVHRFAVHKERTSSRERRNAIDVGLAFPLDFVTSPSSKTEKELAEETMPDYDDELLYEQVYDINSIEIDDTGSVNGSAAEYDDTASFSGEAESQDSITFVTQPNPTAHKNKGAGKATPKGKGRRVIVSDEEEEEEEEEGEKAEEGKKGGKAGNFFV